MGAVEKSVAVVTCDIIDSRRYTATARRRLNDALVMAFESLANETPRLTLTKIDFRITAGDEFQFVLAMPDRALDVVTHLRSRLAIQRFKPIVRFRAAIGIGEVKIRPGKGSELRPYEWDGPAFVAAREGLEAMKRQRSPDRWTVIRTRTDDDTEFDVVLGLIDHLQRAWTPAQWEAIAWTLKGLKRQETAQRIKVAHQNVSKRLNAAGWLPVEAALEFVRYRLAHPCSGAKA